VQAGLVAVQWVLLLLLVGAVVALVSLPFRRTPDVVAEAPDVVAETPEWWRCNVCGMRWRSRGVTRVSRTGLRLRRWVRRRARDRRRTEPGWAAMRGSERCPSCLSRSIRPSRQQD